MPPLHVGSFGGGVALLGASDQRQVNEVLQADGLDLQPRGALVATADASPYVTLLDETGANWATVLGLGDMAGFTGTKVIAVGIGNRIGPTLTYLFSLLDREGMASPVAFVVGQIFGAADAGYVNGGGTNAAGGWATVPPVLPEGVLVTGLMFPGMYWVRFCPPGGAPLGVAQHIQVFLMNLGAREGSAPRTAPGLYVIFLDVASGVVLANCIEFFDSLGTGSSGLLSVPVADVGGEGSGIGGASAQQLFPRGIIAFNNHVWAWGFDAGDPTNGDGPNRVMFCNLGQPLKWGNDNQGATGASRFFTDSDAIVLGDAGEIVRGAIKWAGRLWFGTNQQLHYIGGADRDSFLTDGATPVQKAYNIVGPAALIEGPDRALYGVSDHGLWRTRDGANFEPLFLKLVDFTGRSTGYWDLIWTDPARPVTYPGRTNQDLVWTAVDLARRQVLVGIPFCQAALGYGPGVDTVVLKFHVDAGGFTRQVFAGATLTAALYRQREAQQRETRMLGTQGPQTIQRYGYTVGGAAVPPLAAALPILTSNIMVPFGPEGEGVVRRWYLTLAWQDSSTLPLTFSVSTTVDDLAVDSFTLSIQPSPPAAVDGDLWVDTSNSDPSIGNATATTTIASRAGFLLKTYTNGQWQHIAGLGAKGARVTIPIPVTRLTGTRTTMQVATVSANGRFQFESLSPSPGAGSPAA